MQTEDRSLLIELKEGNRFAFEELYHRYKAQIYYNLLRFVRSETLAEELLQEVFLKVWEGRHQVDIQLSFKAYLFQISKNTAIDFYRKVARQRLMESLLSVVTEDSYEHVEQELDFKEIDSLFRDTIDKLPPKRKQVFEMCRIQGMSYDQVAQELHISPGTVRDHMVKAHRFIRQELGKEWHIILFVLHLSFSAL